MVVTEPLSARRRDGDRGVVVLAAGWSGEGALIRLLSAGGDVRIVGHALDRPVRHPFRHLQSALERGTDGRTRAVFVQPEHLWLINNLDPSGFVAELVAKGVAVLSLRRSSHVDRGLSRALCGPRCEVLPPAPLLLDPGHVAVFASESEDAEAWFGDVELEPELRLVFETDLVAEEARTRTVARLAERLGLEQWSAPRDHDLPLHEELWARVGNPDAVRDGLAVLAGIMRD